MILSVLEQGATIRAIAGRCRVEKRGNLLREIPLENIREYHLIGGVQITTNAMRDALARNIPIHFLTTQGKHLGRVQPNATSFTDLLRHQVRRTDDPEFCLAISKTIVRGKLENTRAVLMHYARKQSNEIFKSAAQFQSDVLEQIESSQDLNVLRGFEGVAAQAHFAAISELLPLEFPQFPGRRRRPPTDPLNAMLSFGYAMLLTRVMTATQLAGLHAGFGFLHVSHGARPALALDLMEEFRTALVDRFALGLISRNRINTDHFETNKTAVLLNPEGRSKFVMLFSQRLNEHVTAPNGKQYTYEQLIQHQARMMAQCIRDNNPNYHPLRVR